MSAAHTPGPWKTGLVEEDANVVYSESDRAIAYCDGDDDSETDDANARLIAAAPELLEALKRAERLIKEALPKFNWGASALDANAISLLNDVPGEVRAALAKVQR